MSVQRRNKKWYAAVYLGIKDGKQVYEWSEPFDNKGDAQLKEIEMKKNVIETNHLVTNKESFVAVMESWLIARKKNKAPATYDQNYYYCNHYIKPYFENYMINKIDTQDVMNFMNQLDVSAATVNKTMNILKQIFDLAVLYKYNRYNPCTGIKKPQIKQKKVTVYSQSDIKKFLSLTEVKESSGYIAFCLLFTTGMRPGEVCGLRWCDWFGDYIIPTIGIDKKRGISDLKNEFAHQSVFINSKIQSELKKLKKFRKEQCLQVGISFNETHFINCFTPDMRPMTPDYLRKLMKKILDRNNMPHISPYNARHSLGTNMMKNGVNPKKVSEVMRHSTVKTTLDRYTHVDEEMKKNTSEEYANSVM